MSRSHSFEGRIVRWLAGLALVAGIAAAPQARAEGCTAPLSSVGMLRPELRESLDTGALSRFYAGRTGCVWNDRDAASLLAALGKVEAQGLDPEDFHLGELLRGGDSAEARDLLLSDAALRYARDMRNGRVELEGIEGDVDFPRPVSDPVGDLRAALDRNDISAWLAALPPSQTGYTRLVQAYASYRALAARGGWGVLEQPAKSVRPGNESPLVPQLRQRLVAEGYLAPSEDQSDTLDAPLVAALSRFQESHGLNADGILGKKTVAELNVSAAERVEEIALNLERWRMLASAIAPTRVEVNAAGAEAALIVDGKTMLKMRTVVGKKKTPTPIVRSVISAVVVNPPWVVPVSIIRKEIMPAIKRDPDYLARNNMYWRDNEVVQAPGEKNSLGRLKFELSSSFDVYLHDTPARSLFSRDDRARSHGCVRLEKPLDLAEDLLGTNPAWPREKIEEAIAEGSTKRIPMENDIQVVILYWTAYVDDDGAMQFRDDLYGRDARLAEALQNQKKSIAGPQASAVAKSCSA